MKAKEEMDVEQEDMEMVGVTGKNMEDRGSGEIGSAVATPNGIS